MRNPQELTKNGRAKISFFLAPNPVTLMVFPLGARKQWNEEYQAAFWELQEISNCLHRTRQTTNTWESLYAGQERRELAKNVAKLIASAKEISQEGTDQERIELTQALRHFNATVKAPYIPQKRTALQTSAAALSGKAGKLRSVGKILMQTGLIVLKVGVLIELGCLAACLLTGGAATPVAAVISFVAIGLAATGGAMLLAGGACTLVSHLGANGRVNRFEQIVEKTMDTFESYQNVPAPGR